MNNKRQIAMEVKVCRVILGFSQDKLAKLSKLNTQTIKRIENHNASPKYETVTILRKVFSDNGILWNQQNNKVTFELIGK